MKIREKIHEFNDYINDFKTEEKNITSELETEIIEIEDYILKLRNLGDKIDELDLEFNRFHNENKEFIKKEILLDYNIVRQEIINLGSRISINHNTFITMERIRGQQEELEKQTKRIEEHDRNMLNIMGAFLAIFSLIGVNFSFFSNFNSESVISWILLIIVVNGSLIFAIIMIFICIKFLFLKDFSWLNRKKEEIK